MITFPHKGIIVAIDQLTLFASSSQVTKSVPLIGRALHLYYHIRVMGTFYLPIPSLIDIYPSISYINMISSSTNPWIVPNDSNNHSFFFTL